MREFEGKWPEWVELTGELSNNHSLPRWRLEKQKSQQVKSSGF